MAKSRAQQAAIAISMKKAGKKPKKMQKGGKAKTLNKVSKQLAKASKMHAGQSKKIAKLAEMMKEGGYPKSDKNDFMKRMGYYQGGGLAATPMYGSNTIPGSPETASITYQEADKARLKALEEELKEAQESTKFQDEAQAEIAEQQAKINKIESGVSTGVDALEKLGAFDKLKEKGQLKEAAKLAKAGQGADNFLAGVTLGKAGTGELGKKLAPKLFEKATMSAVPSTSSLPSNLANFSAQPLQLGQTSTSLVPSSMGTQGANLLNTGANVGTSAASSGLSVPTLGTVAAIGGEVLKQASSDQDETTMNVGETTGTIVSGAGKGIGAALTAGTLLGSSVGPIGTVAGAILGAGYGLGKGLIQRSKARKAEAAAERKKEAQLGQIASKRRLEAIKSKEYSGFDFGADLRQSGGFSKKLDALQDSLTVAGVFPALGAVPDLINTGISGGRAVYNYAKGDTAAAKANLANAGVSLVSAVPVYGDALSVPKVAKTAIKYGSKVKKGKAATRLAEPLVSQPMMPSTDMDQTFAAETTGVRPPIVPELLNLPKVPQQPPIPKIGPSTRKHGGVKLPGGVAKPIPGSDAIEFKGRSHAQGGIMVDPMTEVEGNETMDKVTMKNGGKSDYFFSQHLKMGGKSFAQRHKDILKNGGRQKDIDALAKLQEKKAGRNPNVVKLGAGGYYQGGGPFSKNPNDFGQVYDDGTPVYNDQGLVQPPASLVQNFQNTMYPQLDEGPNPYGLDLNLNGVPDYLENQSDFRVVPNEEKNEDETTSTPTTNNTSGGSSPKSEKRENVELTRIEPKRITQIPVDNSIVPGTYVDLEGNTVVPQAEMGPPEFDYNSLSDEDKSVVDKANSGADLTDLEKKALKRLNRDVPGLALAAGAAQLIAPAYAFFKKDRVAEQMGAPGRIKAPTLDRISYNTERAANAADNRAMNRFIETSGIGPAGIIAKMSAYRRKQEGDLKIAAQESRVNTEIANREAQMAQQANIRNVANRMQVDQINTQLREAQLAANENRRLEAIDAFTERTAGLAGDLMSYKATERLARATGDMGIYERDRLRNFLKNQINPRTGKPYTNADIAEVFNKRFAQPTATEDDKKDDKKDS